LAANSIVALDIMACKKYKGLEKLDDNTRRQVGREFGFRQNSYIDWKVEQGYFFCLEHLISYHSAHTTTVLTVKPLYADDLWWEIFDCQKCLKAPMSLRGDGAFAVPKQTIGDYGAIARKIFAENIDENSAEELDAIWHEIFKAVASDIERFLQENPDPDRFVPDESRVSLGHGGLLSLMALIRQGREEEAVAIIRERQGQGKSCGLVAGNTDGYEFILDWCRAKRGKSSL
jgi:hypothetical protein